MTDHELYAVFAAEPKWAAFIRRTECFLDPTAEHGDSFVSLYVPCFDQLFRTDLFQRLRNLPRNKTMIFSSHRFGNLTRQQISFCKELLDHRTQLTADRLSDI